MSRLLAPLLILVVLGVIALIIQSQNSGTTSSSSSSSNSKQSLPSQSNKEQNIIEVPQQEVTEQQQPPKKFTEDKLVTCPPQASSSSSNCPSNRFVERYFSTDPTAKEFLKTAWNPNAESEEEDQSFKDKISSTKGHTGSGIPKAFKELLLKHLPQQQQNFLKIDENADKYFGAAKVVESLEFKCGWDGIKGEFTKNPNCLKEIFGGESTTTTTIPSALKSFFLSSSNNNDNDDDADTELLKKAPQLMDIVIPSIRDLDFLEQWRQIIEPFHLILIQDGDPTKMLKIPSWADYELHNRNDIEKALGENSWIISQKDASIRNFGFLISKKRFVYTLDDDCLPVTSSASTTKNTKKQNGRCSTLDPQDLYKISSRNNPILGHLKNLLTPSTPYFFNTLYDGYKEGADFVRGFPYSMRDGVPTVISHGLWLNNPDYDAPTQLLKPKEKNTNHLDGAVITIPAGVLYPMCSMNVAFDRKRIGPAFMQGLMGVGMPWARYDDMFAGWASKVVADHLAVGVKSGAPYIFHNKASNPFTNLKKEYKGLWWQEVVISFCNRVQLPVNATTPESSYRALALAIRKDLLPLHPYFDRLATAMLAWVDAWEQAEAGTLKFSPSRTSIEERKDLVKSMASGSSSSSSSSSPLSCVTYEQRYSECLKLIRQPLSVRAEYFSRISRSSSSSTKNSATTTEAILLHISNDDSDDVIQQIVRRDRETSNSKTILNKNLKKLWKKDLWLSTCSLIMENSNNNKDIFLLVTEGQERHIPREFLPLVHTQSPSLTKSLFSSAALTGGRTNTNNNNRQDLSASLFLKFHPQYNFVWVIDSATRYASSSQWSNLLNKGGAGKIFEGNEDSPYKYRETETEFSSPIKIQNTKYEEFWTSEDSIDYHFATLKDDNDDGGGDNSASFDETHHQGNQANKVPFGVRVPATETQNQENETSTPPPLLFQHQNPLPHLYGLKLSDPHLVIYSPISLAKQQQGDDDNSAPVPIIIKSSIPIFGMSRTLADAIYSEALSSSINGANGKQQQISSQDDFLLSVAMKNRLKIVSMKTEYDHIFSSIGEQHKKKSAFHSKFHMSWIYSSWMSNTPMISSLKMLAMSESWKNASLYFDAPKIEGDNGDGGDHLKKIIEKFEGKTCLEDFLIYPVRL